MLRILSDWECKYCGANLMFVGGRCFKCGMRQG